MICQIIAFSTSWETIKSSWPRPGYATYESNNSFFILLLPSLKFWGIKKKKFHPLLELVTSSIQCSAERHFGFMLLTQCSLMAQMKKSHLSHLMDVCTHAFCASIFVTLREVCSFVSHVVLALWHRWIPQFVMFPLSPAGCLCVYFYLCGLSLS